MANDISPLFTYVDQTIRAGLILFLLFCAIKYKNWGMMLVLSFSSVSLYFLVRHRITPSNNLALALAGEVVAFMLVYMLYQYMRMTHVIKSSNEAGIEAEQEEDRNGGVG